MHKEANIRGERSFCSFRIIWNRSAKPFSFALTAVTVQVSEYMLSRPCSGETVSGSIHLALSTLAQN